MELYLNLNLTCDKIAVFPPSGGPTSSKEFPLDAERLLLKKMVTITCQLAFELWLGIEIPARKKNATRKAEIMKV